MGILKMCLNKKQFADFRSAYEAGKPLGQRPYQCPYCLQFHLTTKGVSSKYHAGPQ